MSRTLLVKLTPSARKNDIAGWAKNEHGDDYLKVSVTTVPEKGKANKAMIALLAKHYKIPKSSITITKGETERLKTLKISEGVILEI